MGIVFWGNPALLVFVLEMITLDYEPGLRIWQKFL